MKYLLLMIAAASAYGQTGFPGPVQVRPSNSGIPQAIELRDGQTSKNQFIGLKAPSTVAAITILSADMGNPMEVTVAATPFTIQDGEVTTVTITGAAGSGCSGMNGTFTIGSPTATTFQITYDASGCTYTPGSASFTVGQNWRLWDADGGAGQCLGWSSSYIIGWVSCGGGGSTPPFVDTQTIIKGSGDATKLLRFEVDGFTTATTRVLTPKDASYIIAGSDLDNLFTTTQTMHDIDFATADTYKIGITNPAYEVDAYRFNGAGMGRTPSNSYITTRKLELWDSLFGGASAVSLLGFVNGGVSGFSFNDSTGNQFLSIYNSGAPAIQPTTDASIYLGQRTNRFKALWLSDLSGGGTQCVQVDNDGLLSTTGGGCGGSGSSPPFVDTTNLIYKSGDPTALLRISAANVPTAITRTMTAPNANFTFAGIDISQTFTPDQTFGSKILFSSNNSSDIGTQASQAKDLYVYGIGQIQRLRLSDMSGTTLSDYFDLRMSALATLQLTDSSANVIELYQNILRPQFFWRGDMSPSTSTTYDNGLNTFRWRKYWGQDADLSGSAVISNALSVGTTLTLTGGIGSSSIIFSGNGNPIIWPNGTNLQSGQLQIWAAGVARILVNPGGASGSGSFRGFNTAGDRFWGFKAATATTGTSIEWELPTSDAAGFLKSNGAGVLSFDTACCADTTLSNLTATTAINQDLFPSSDGARSLGSSTVRWNTIEVSSQVSVRTSSGGNRRCRVSGGSLDCFDGASNTVFTAASLTGQITSAALAGTGTRCLQADNSGNINVAGAGCSTATGTVTSIGTTGPISGGTITTSGTISCPTCFTTAGGQSVSGTSTFSTVSISSALAGTFNLSGNETVTGNFYMRTFSGGNASCGGVNDGWQGNRTDNSNIQFCDGGTTNVVYGIGTGDSAITASGTVCTITAIKNGHITAATCI